MVLGFPGSSFAFGVRVFGSLVFGISCFMIFGFPGFVSGSSVLGFSFSWVLDVLVLGLDFRVFFAVWLIL